MAFDFASIGLRIKHARTKKRITQEQLAERIEVSRNQIVLLENGERGVSLEMLSINTHLHLPQYSQKP